MNLELGHWALAGAKKLVEILPPHGEPGGHMWQNRLI
jgi:hypothetical protein